MRLATDFKYAGWLGLMLALGSGLLLAQANGASGSEQKTIVVLGDSLAAGRGLDPNDAYPARLQEKIKTAGWAFNVVNAGLSGDTTAGGLRRLDWVLKRHVDVLVLELGGNDGLRGTSVEGMRTNLQTIITRTKQKYPGSQVVLVGMKMPPNLGSYAEQFNAVFPEVAQQNRTAFVPFLLEGVGGNANLNQEDGIHPTSEGQKILADNVWKILAPLLSKMAGAGGSAKSN